LLFTGFGGIRELLCFWGFFFVKQVAEAGGRREEDGCYLREKLFKKIYDVTKKAIE
jgi:hypothetical protein